MQTKQTNLPFFPFFNALRKNSDFFLGIEEYYTFINVLRGEFVYNKETGIIDRNKLLDICKLLWLKPNQSPIIFENIFNEYITREIKEDFFNNEDKNNSDNTNNNENDLTNKSNNLKTSQPNDTDNKTTNNEDNQNSRLKEQKTEPDISQNNQETANNEPINVKITLGNPEGENTGVETDKTKIRKRNFVFTTDYFPISRRQVSLYWNYLPQKTKNGTTDIININKTVENTAKHGFTSELFYHKQHEIINSAILLTDHKYSMIAFDQLSDLLEETLHNSFLIKGGNKSRMDRYFFYNIPHDVVFKNREHTKIETVKNFLSKYKNKSSIIIIVSDAGAARGNNSNKRVRITMRFLYKLSTINKNVVWLNPMPKERWRNTSAERISRFVPMFNVEINNFKKIVSALKGKISI